MTDQAANTHSPTPAAEQLALRLSEGLGPVVPKREELRLTIKVKRELFRFHCQQEWVNKAQRWYASCGVRAGHYITVDAHGQVMHMGKCLMEAARQEAYPVTVYELQTNWPEGA